MPPLFPYQRLVFESPLSREEITRRLTRKVTKRRQDWFEKSTLPFEGTVSDTGFKVSRIINYRNSFLPVIDGRFFPLMRGVRVQVTVRLPANVLFFCVVWFSLVGLIGLGSILSPSSVKGVSAFEMLIGVLAMSVFFYLLVTLSFRFEAKKASKLLSEVFEAEGSIAKKT